MGKVGFDKVEIDPMGNVLGYIGHGKHVIAMDAHIDTVGIGDRNLWNYDPYKGFEDDEIIIGRGSTDQEGGMVSMVYAGKIIKDIGLEDDYTLIVTGTVQEEDFDGLCWQYIVNESNIKPEFVVITEPTSLNIYRGHRGRMEIKVTTHGVSCHGSAPERGDNAIFKKIIAAHDIGKAVNPRNVEGQIEGGVVMSLGYALTEDYLLKDSVPTAKFGTLGLFRSTNVPEIQSMIIEKNKRSIAYGAKGIGEIAAIPPAPAVQGAYYKLDGNFRTKLPLEDTAYRKKNKK
jgi:acetylornithine deacetylase/succinyl-diaminopimelate desuccinylase-like protein